MRSSHVAFIGVPSSWVTSFSAKTLRGVGPERCDDRTVDGRVEPGGYDGAKPADFTVTP
jgi:hypothetical protein